MMRRCEAAGLDFHDEESEVIVYFPGTAGVYINGGPHAKWVLQEPFEDYEVLEGFEASWSASQQVIECNLVHLNRNTKMGVGIGRGEYLASLDEDMKEVQRRVEGKGPQSKEQQRQKLIQKTL